MLIVPSNIGPTSAITIVFLAAAFSGDLTQVSAVNVNMQRQNGTTSNLTFSILSQTPYELVAQYTFVGGEIQGTGAYMLAPVLTVPGGTRNPSSVAMFVASPFATAPILRDFSWLGTSTTQAPSTLTGAFTQTTAPFTQPASGANVTVNVLSSVWMAVGQPIFLQVGGIYTVVSLPNTTSVVLKNLGYATNAAPTTNITTGQQVTAGGVAGAAGPGQAGGPLTTVAAGATTTLSQAIAQRVNLAQDGSSAATVLFPASPNDADSISVKGTGTTVAHVGVMNPNGFNIENPLSPGSIGSSNVTLDPLNPGSSAIFVFEAGTPGVWRLRS